MRVRLLAGAVLATIILPVAAEAADLTFTLDNQSGAALHELYASPVDTDNWKQNILGAPVLETGRTALVAIPDGASACIYDLKMIFAEAEEIDAQGVDLCATHSYTISDPGE